MGLFGKRRISEGDAVGLFLHQSKTRVFEEWPGLARQINATLKTHLPDNVEAIAEVLTAVLSIKLHCLPNLFPQEQANRLRGDVDSRLRNGIVELVASYDRIWDEAIEDNVHPQEAIATALIYNRFGSKDRVQIGEQFVPSPLLVTLVGTALVELSGAWWKNLLSKYRVVP
jgi:hypothetical protein